MKIITEVPVDQIITKLDLSLSIVIIITQLRIATKILCLSILIIITHLRIATKILLIYLRYPQD